MANDFDKQNGKKFPVILAVLLALLLAVGIGFLEMQQQTGSDTELQENSSTQALFRFASDGCFCSAVVYLGIGLFSWISTSGFFDIFGYAAKSLLVLFTSLRNPKGHEKYGDYKARKDQHRGKPRYLLIIIGGVFLLLSLGFLALFYT